jgi:diaminopimelate decarboxylase/aspartate kinase
MQLAQDLPRRNRHWLVMKFGGSSVSSSRRWATIVEQARRGLDSQHHVLLVVSALSGVTDLLAGVADASTPAGRTEALDQIELRHRRLMAGRMEVSCFQQHWRCWA